MPIHPILTAHDGSVPHTATLVQVNTANDRRIRRDKRIRGNGGVFVEQVHHRAMARKWLLEYRVVKEAQASPVDGRPGFPAEARRTVGMRAAGTHCKYPWPSIRAPESPADFRKESPDDGHF